MSNRRFSVHHFFRKLSGDALRKKIEMQGDISLDRVYGMTHNRETRRMTIRANRRHGRGYTTPSYGRAHTRGSGRS